MIFSVSTLFLAALVFNAASALGAPLRHLDTRSAQVSSPQLTGNSPPNTAILDAVSQLDPALLSEGDVYENGVSQMLKSREQHEPEAREESQLPGRRYPRRIYHNFYEKREPQPETTAELVSHGQDKPEAREDSQPLVRRYPRRIYYDFYEKREPEPATVVKESTVVITKVTTYDLPADVAAHPKVHNSFTSTLFSSGFTMTLPSIPSGTPSSVSVISTTTPVPTVTPATSTSSPSTITPTPVSSNPVVSPTPTSTATPTISLTPTSTMVSH